MDDTPNTDAETPVGGPPSRLCRYLRALGTRAPDPGAAGFWAGIDSLSRTLPLVAESILREMRTQQDALKLIASENYCSLPVQLAHGNLLTDKYAEGAPGHRFYAGCENVDAIESEAVRLAQALFGAEHAYVQPHSGADANLVAFLAVLNVTVESPALARLGTDDAVKIDRVDWEELRTELREQRLLALDYYSGGHLTHGYRHNFSSRLFDAYTYSVDRVTGLLDYDAIRKQALDVRPRILLAGYSAYPRLIDFARMREIADEAGAVLMVDMAHFAGLVAGGVLTGVYNPIPYAEIVTSTTHKTLRGPRGGLVLCTKRFAEAVDRGCPTILGGPLPHVIAAKAVAFKEASQPEFRLYAQRIVDNARGLADGLLRRGLRLLTGGTDNHLLLIDLAATTDLTGRQAERALRACGITVNRNSIPFDVNGPWYTSGLRIGTAAVTTRGFGEAEMGAIADVIADVLAATKPGTTKDGKVSRATVEVDPAAAESARARVGDLVGRFPLYPEIELDLVDADGSGDAALVTR